ncbi:NUC189-domain-containing protein [Choiromyces venosus 120613-1]|uniref:NUC189-domain-containing protein n=1 Tax=Choiromyces venosus 120613-1 TaxID=1336337 RepID=A0A3N4K4P8_9PEZI|nr:NUC189-domain-containing protein [Choiromyces venosus 120613-1]
MVNLKQKPPGKARIAPPSMSEAINSSSAQNILVSAFSSSLQLPYFASVILGLDAQRLRIHDTVTNKLRCELTLDKGVAVNHLTWGEIPNPEETTKNHKRKRTEANGEGGRNTNIGVVAASTSRGGILLVNPLEGTIQGKLTSSGHSGEVRQFIFSGKKLPSRGWSVGSDKRLIEWDIKRKVAMRVIPLKDALVQSVTFAPPFALCGSHKVYAIDYENPGKREALEFAASTTPIHTIIATDDNKLFLSVAETDRFVNVFSIEGRNLEGSLVAESDVRIITVYDSKILVAVTTDGTVELFKNPFAPVSSNHTSKRRGTTTRTADAVVRVRRATTSSVVPIVSACLQGDELILVCLEGGVSLFFERIRWSSVETGELALVGHIDISRHVGIGASASGAINEPRHAVDTLKAVVVGGGDLRDVEMGYISQGEESTAAVDEETDGEGTSDEEDGVEQTFGEKAQALKVTGAAKAPESQVARLQEVSNAVVKAPATGSLTTVLTQALQTDDNSLLESCLHSTDDGAILATIRRLNSSLAVTLLERLAERIARHPARSKQLGTWVKWIAVAHGGYLVTLPDLVSQISELHQIVSARADSMPKLLSLQGRLEMLSAQMKFRSAPASASKQDEDNKVLYMEGAGDNDSESESDDEPENVGLEGFHIEDASFINAEESIDDDDSASDSGTSNSDAGLSNAEGYVDSDDDEDEDEDGRPNGHRMSDFFDGEAIESSAQDEMDEEEAVDEDSEMEDGDDEGDGDSEDDRRVVEQIRKSKKVSR